jgi:hypothetical protein
MFDRKPDNLGSLITVSNPLKGGGLRCRKAEHHVNCFTPSREQVRLPIGVSYAIEYKIEKPDPVVSL